MAAHAHAAARSDSTIAPTDADFGSEQLIALHDGSTVVLEPRWSHFQRHGVDIIESPEKMLRVFLVRGEHGEGDEEAIRHAWLKVKPDFLLEPSATTRPLRLNGWDRLCRVGYHVAPSDEQSVWADLRAFRGQTYISLVEGPRHVIARRGAQLVSIVQSWIPRDFAQRKLDARVVRAFSPDDFAAFVSSAMKALQVPAASV